MTKRKTTRSVRKTKRSVRKTNRKTKRIVRKTSRKTSRQSAGSGVKVTPSPGTLGNILTGMTITIAAVKAWDEWMGDSAKMNKIKTQGDKMTILIGHLVNRIAETLQYGIEQLSILDSKYDKFMRTSDATVPEMRREYRDVLLNLPNGIKREYETFVTESIYQLFILFNNSPNEVKFMKKFHFTNGLSKSVIDNYSFNPRGLSRIRMFELLQHPSLINKSYEAFTRADRGTKPTIPKKYSDFYNFIYRYIFPILDKSLTRGASGSRQRGRQRAPLSRPRQYDTRTRQQERRSPRHLSRQDAFARHSRAGGDTRWFLDANYPDESDYGYSDDDNDNDDADWWR